MFDRGFQIVADRYVIIMGECYTLHTADSKKE